MYEYQAQIVRVIDGDTIIATIDLGFFMTATIHFRLNRINAPELDGQERAAGLAAKEYLAGRIEGKTVTMDTDKPDKYGRWLAVITLDGVNINDEMVTKGYAKQWDGHGPRPV